MPPTFPPAARTSVAFTKMHSSGNDYIYVNTMQHRLADPAGVSVRWSAAHTGIGADGVVLVGASDIADFSMRIFNADGSEALMCGNAAICVGKFLHDHQLTSNTAVTLETRSGVREMRLHLDGASVDTVAVNMGPPKILQLDAPVQCDGSCVVGAEISMGNPHFVVYVDDVAAVNLKRVGPLIEHDSRFVDRTNVEFAHVCPDGAIRMRVWERGSGVTQGCGSGASAAAVAAILGGRVARDVCVHMDGGTLKVHWEDGGPVWITGRAVRVFDGVITV